MSWQGPTMLCMFTWLLHMRFALSDSSVSCYQILGILFGAVFPFFLVIYAAYKVRHHHGMRFLLREVNTLANFYELAEEAATQQELRDAIHETGDAKQGIKSAEHRHHMLQQEQEHAQEHAHDSRVVSDENGVFHEIQPHHHKHEGAANGTNAAAYPDTPHPPPPPILSPGGTSNGPQTPRDQMQWGQAGPEGSIKSPKIVAQYSGAGRSVGGSESIEGQAPKGKSKLRDRTMYEWAIMWLWTEYVDKERMTHNRKDHLLLLHWGFFYEDFNTKGWLWFFFDAVMKMALAAATILEYPPANAAVFLSVIGVDLFAFAIVKPPSDNIRAALTLFYKTLQFLAAFVAFGPPLEIFDKGACARGVIAILIVVWAVQIVDMCGK
ncbi:hypothetical protein T484DRAFT_1833045 [Baffinella frigidus]|nr:hypothetical protein T484DRAFT_1833045 [Cryptophyta sp. CCMP2293]